MHIQRMSGRHFPGVRTDESRKRRLLAVGLATSLLALAPPARPDSGADISDLRRALRRVEAAVDTPPAVRVALLGQLATAELAGDAAEEAAAHGQRCVEVGRSAGVGETPEMKTCEHAWVDATRQLVEAAIAEKQAGGAPDPGDTTLTDALARAERAVVVASVTFPPHRVNCLLILAGMVRPADAALALALETRAAVALAKEEREAWPNLLPQVLVNRGFSHYRLQRFTSAEVDFREAADLLGPGPDEQDGLRLTALNQLALALLAQDRHDDAWAVSLRAQVVDRRSLDLPKAQHGSSLGIARNIAEDQGHPQEALAYLEEEVGILRRAGGADGTALANALAELCELRRRYQGAGTSDPTCAEALDLMTTLPAGSGRERASLGLSMAEDELKQGSQGRALVLLDEAHDDILATIPTQPYYAAMLLRSEGGLRQKLGQMAQAREVWDLALRLAERERGPHDPLIASIWVTRAASENVRENYALARRAVAAAHTAADGYLPPDDKIYALLDGNEAVWLQDEGKPLEAAERYRHALGIWTAIRGPDGLSTVETLSQLGVSLYAGGAYAEAHDVAQQLLAIRIRTDGAGAPRTLDMQTRLGLTEYAMGQDEAARHTLQEAWDHTWALVEPALDAASPTQGLAALMNVRWQLDALLTLLNRPEDTEAAYRAVLRVKGAVTQRVRLRSKALREEPAVQDQLASLKQASAEYAALLHGGRWSPEAAHAITARMETMERELARRPAAGALLAPVDTASLCARLAPDEALVDYVVYFRYHRGAKDRGRLAEITARAFVMRGGTCALAQEDLNLIKAIGAIRAGTAASKIDLAAEIWAPVARHLAGVHTVYLAADGPLQEVSFASLPTGGTGRAPHYLIEDYALSYLDQARSLLEIPPVGQRRPLSPPSDGTALIVGDVAFARPESARGAEAPTCVFHPPARLRGSGEEAKAVEAALTRAGWSRTPPLLRTDATEAAVGAAIADADLVHLATHSLIAACPNRLNADANTAARLSERPESAAALLLAPDAGNDGVFTAEEIAHLRLRHDALVVISACDGGDGEPVVGEGLLGLRRAIAEAGAAHAVLAVDPIDDEASGRFMERFYEAWLAKTPVPPWQALRQAQLATLAAAREAGHPDGDVAVWGSFIATGPGWR